MYGFEHMISSSNTMLETNFPKRSLKVVGWCRFLLSIYIEFSCVLVGNIGCNCLNGLKALNLDISFELVNLDIYGVYGRWLLNAYVDLIQIDLIPNLTQFHVY